MTVQPHPPAVPARPNMPPAATPQWHTDSSPIFTLGTLGIEIDSLSRQDSLGQLTADGTVDNPHDLAHLMTTHPQAAEEVYWSLDMQGRPAFALVPSGPHAALVHQRLVRLLIEQIQGSIERISLAGYRLQDSLRLPSGHEIPIVRPVLRGLYGWSTKQLVDELMTDARLPADQLESTRNTLRHTLDRLYDDLHGGDKSWHRAVHYVLTNPYVFGHVVIDAASRGLELKNLRAEDLQTARSDSRHLVRLTLTFLDRDEEQDEMLRHIDVDVHDIVPVICSESDRGEPARTPLRYHHAGSRASSSSDPTSYTHDEQETTS
ncbi:MAG: hypothetical protein AAGD38_16710 [Acidobacteriota bacterium]